MNRLIAAVLLILTLSLSGCSGGSDAGGTTAQTMNKLPDTGQTTSYTATFGEDHDYTINPPSLTVNANGTVTDNVTGLMWQREDDNTGRTWDEAVNYCSGLGLAGYSDWRLPSKKELVSILDLGTFSPAINTTAFPGTDAEYYWSSTTYAYYDAAYAWRVSFGSGFVHGYDKSIGSLVRCVR